jgi:cell division protein FtsN
MQTNHPRERKKKSFLWIIVVIAVLLAGAFVLYSRHMGSHPAPVVARGKIPPPPPSPSVESPVGPPTSMESAPAAGTDSPESASGTQSQSGLKSPPVDSLDAGSQESVPETVSEIAAPPQEDTGAAGTGQEPVGDAEQTGLSDSSDGQAATPGSDDGQSAAAAVDELQAAAKETPESPSPADTVAPPSSDQPATDAEPNPAALSPGVPEAATPFTIQVGAYRSKDNADRQVTLLREKGFDAYIYEKDDKDQQAWYFVRFGRFENFGSASKALTIFKDQEHMDGAVVRSNSN